MNDKLRNTASGARRPFRQTAAIGLATLVLASAPGVALAAGSNGDPTSDQYKSAIPTIIDGGSAQPTTTPGLQEEIISGLPFTGLDLIALVAVAVALIAMGFALRNLTAERD